MVYYEGLSSTFYLIWLTSKLVTLYILMRTFYTMFRYITFFVNVT